MKTLRERMIQETEKFLELELNRDTIPAPPVDEEDALFIVMQPENQTRKVS
jgi:hypothetical protein